MVGTGVPGLANDGELAAVSPLNEPAAAIVDDDGTVYVADSGNHRVLAIDTDGRIRTVAGSGEGGGGFSGDGGPAVEAALDAPIALALDVAGRLLIADSGNGRIRRVEHSGVIVTVAGNGLTSPLEAGGPAVESVLLLPSDVKIDATGSLLIADAGAHRVYRLRADGLLYLVAGSGEQGAGADGSRAAAAALDEPTGVEADGIGGVYIADSGNRRLVHVDADGVLRVLAVGSDASLPVRLARTPDGTGLAFADASAHRILQLPVERLLSSPSSVVSQRFVHKVV